MLGRAVGITVASALGASAFLIPAAIDPFPHTESTDLALGNLNSKQSIVQLACSECAFSPKQKEKTEEVKDVEQSGDEFWIQGGANSIIVNVTISTDGKKLEINGETIYPLDWQLESLMSHRVYVNQVPLSASIEDIESGKAKATPLEVTGSGVAIQEGEVVSPQGHVIIPVKHTIFELEHQPVSLDQVLIKVLQTAEGELFLAHVSTAHPNAPLPVHFFGGDEKDAKLPSIMPHAHHGPPVACHNLPASLCKLVQMVQDRFTSLRQGHGGKKGLRKHRCHMGMGKGKGMHGGKPPAMLLPADAPPHHRKPDGRHHEHQKHHFMHSFTRGLAAVLIPTMAGVAVGIVVSLFGLCLGRLISFLWVKLYRGGRRGYESVRLEEEEDGEDDADMKKDVVLEQSEPLPVYEAAPSYEEAQSEQK